jgi:hypothetical protein
LHLVADAHNLLFQQRVMYTSLVKIHFKIKQFVFWSFELLFRVLEPLGILLFILELHHSIKLGVIQFVWLVHHQSSTICLFILKQFLL